MNCHFRRQATSAMLLALLIVFSAILALGQGIVTGSASGVVQDPQGAVINAASVSATQLETNRQFQTVTNNSGQFALRQLPPGHYAITISSPNFQDFKVENLQVVVGQDSSVGNVKMQLGNKQETVTVEGAAPIVESTTNEISSSFDTKKAADLPVGNTFDSLALFVPGVATAGDGGFGNNNGAEFSVNGQRARSNNYQLDGQSNNDNVIGGPSIFFGNQDVIAEVQVVTNYSAEYGRNVGSVVNYVTKSGTNSYHGTAYEFWQGSHFDSLENQEKNPLLGFCTPGQDPSAGCTKPEVSRYVDNRFGGTIGGPIKKDKVWFFGSTNLERLRQGAAPSSSGNSLTPTFTGLQQLQTAFPNNPGVAALASIGPQAIKSGNPSFTGVTTRLVSDDPTVDCTATPGSCVPIQFGTITRFIPSIFNDYEATGRIDTQLTQKDRLFGRYIFQQTIFTNEQFFGGAAGAAGNFVDVGGRSQQIGLDLTHTFNERFLDQTRFSYSRSRSSFDGGAFPNCLQTNLAGCTPQINLLSPNDLSFGENIVFPQGRIINIYQVQNNASYAKDKHLLKFGGEYDHQRSPNFGLFNVNGLYNFADFNALLANQPLAVSITQGNFELPLKENDLAFYFQDDWRIKDNLTLNLGLRWEWDSQAINLLHDLSVKQQTGPHPFWDTSLPLNQTTVNTVPEHWHNFGPVLGFAWTPRIFKKIMGEDQTVIRGGFRIAYEYEYYNMGTNVGGGAPFVNAVNFSPTNLPGLPNGTNFFAPAIQAALLPLAPTGGNPGFRGQTILSPTFGTPYSQQWNLGVQRRIGPKTAVEVRYVGSHTLHNFQETNGNPALSPLIQAGFGNLIPPGLTPCTTPGAPGSDFGRVDCSRTNVVKYDTTAYSIYHALQSELRMQNWHGLTANATYTFSKTIDNTSEAFSSQGGFGGNTLAYAQNPFDISRAERGISGYSYPHVVGVLMIYDLPFFKGQTGFLGRALGGWEVSTTYRYTSGQPYTVVQVPPSNGLSLCDPTNFTGGSVFDACRPILENRGAPFASVGTCTNPAAADCGIVDIASSQPTTLSAVHWIINDNNAAKFLGSPFLGAARNLYRGQPISTANLSVFKNLKLTERFTMQLQAQAFNVMNTQFRGVPFADVDGAVNGSFGSTAFNNNGGGTFAGNTVYDGIARRRLLFGAKVIF
ncbi:MAG TPA: TonB-dependent receptor [Terriglobales bacterium]|nr:TonB-dependent receptor [Terriglobales bacterium]